MAVTYKLISSVTVGAGGASSIDFTSIPATYTDLCLKVSLSVNQAGDTWSNFWLTFNGSSSSYSERLLYGTGSSAASAATSGAKISLLYADGDAATTGTFGNGEIYIPNYAGSNNKSLSADTITENNGSAALAAMTAGLWSNTSAINQITLVPYTTTFKQYSTAYLYGIKNS